MPRRKGRHRNTFRRKFQPTYHLQSHRTIVKYLRRITRGWDGLQSDVDAFEQDPLDNLYVPIQIMYEVSPEAQAETLRRLEALSADLRARQADEETGRMRPTPHDGHAPANSPIQADWPEAPEPSPGNSGEAPPRPRVLCL